MKSDPKVSQRPGPLRGWDALSGGAELSRGVGARLKLHRHAFHRHHNTQMPFLSPSGFQLPDKLAEPLQRRWAAARVSRSSDIVRLGWANEGFR